MTASVSVAPTVAQNLFTISMSFDCLLSLAPFGASLHLQWVSILHCSRHIRFSISICLGLRSDGCARSIQEQLLFAFGGNILIGSSLNCVQRTYRASFFGGRDLALSMIWNYQLIMMLAGLGYLFGITQSIECAEPEWYVDI